MNTAWNLDWDYKGWVKYTTKESDTTQDEWNQTLNTIINQLSFQIHKGGLFGSADTVKIHSELLPIFESFVYINKTDSGELFLSNKYKIIIDNKINKDRVYVYLKNLPDKAIIKDKTIYTHKKSGKLSEYKKMVKTDSTLKLKLIPQRKFNGKILVKNFFDETNTPKPKENKIKSFFKLLLDLFKNKVY